MSAKYFAKSQPLSPNTKTYVENGVRYIKDKRFRNGRRRVNGVWCSDSIYYLWFEYLKRSEKYKTACANNGKNMQKLYKDFGNIFEYKNVDGFWNWYKQFGENIFGAKTVSNVEAFFSVDDVDAYKTQIENGEILLLAVATVGSKERMKKFANKMIDTVDVQQVKKQKAKYEVANSKVDVKSLKKALLAYDLHYTKKKDILEVGLIVREFDKREFDDWIADGRKKQTEYGFVDMLEWCENNRKEYERVYKKAEAIVSKRIKDKYVADVDVDELIDAEMMRLKTNYVRTSMKKSIRTYTHKLLKKAERNIKAVENGTFGLGIYE